MRIRTRLNYATRLKNHLQLLASCLSLSITMYLCSKRNYQLKYKRNSPIFERKFLPGYVKPAIVRKLSGYPRNGISVGVPASGLAHRTTKHTIEVLACWNCTQRVFYTAVPDKSGYSHERVN